MAEIISAEHIASYGNSADTRFEPQRKNNFTVRFTLPGGLEPVTRESMLALSVKELPFPQEETQVVDIPFGNEIRKVAGITTFSNEQLTVHDWVDSEVADLIRQWRSYVYSPTDDGTFAAGRIGFASEYKTEGDLLMFGPDGGVRSGKVRIWRLYGLWPRRVRYGKGAMGATADANEIEIEFVIDKYAYLGLQAM